MKVWILVIVKMKVWFNVEVKVKYLNISTPYFKTFGNQMSFGGGRSGFPVSGIPSEVKIFLSQTYSCWLS